MYHSLTLFAILPICVAVNHDSDMGHIECSNLSPGVPTMRYRGRKHEKRICVEIVRSKSISMR